MINFLDTSAILNGAYNEYNHKTFSLLVLSELENIKTSRLKDDTLKTLARKALREIKENPFDYTCYSQKKVKKYLNKYSFLQDINDHKILCEALILAHDRKESVNFITSDLSLFLTAKIFEELTPYLYSKKENIQDYEGVLKYEPKETEIISLYSHPEMNILNLKNNQYCSLFEKGELIDIIKWSEDKNMPLNYKPFKSILGEKISPRNTEQKMLFDLLQNRQVPVKLCLGRFGSGKSYLMLSHALNLIQKGEFDKIVFVKNNIEVKDTGKIGILPGDALEKLAPFIQQIADHIGQDALNSMLDEGIIEPIHLGFMRGRDIKNAIILCDEVENMTKQHIQLLIGRVSTGSELWLAGDLKQTDSISFERNSGVQALISSLAGNKLFGMVKLIKSERSQVAALADQLD